MTVAAACTYRAGSWWLLPAMLAWSVGLVAAVFFDAAAKRIPTPVVRPAAAATAALLVASALLTGEWWPVLVATIVAAASGLILAVCWRFAGLGFGDVRLGVLGGLGLGHTHAFALVTAAVVFAVIAGVHALVTYLRTRDRTATFPLGPALAAGFVTAAIL